MLLCPLKVLILVLVLVLVDALILALVLVLNFGPCLHPDCFLYFDSRTYFCPCPLPCHWLDSCVCPRPGPCLYSGPCVLVLFLVIIFDPCTMQVL